MIQNTCQGIDVAAGIRIAGVVGLLGRHVEIVADHRIAGRDVDLHLDLQGGVEGGLLLLEHRLPLGSVPGSSIIATFRVGAG